MGSSRQFSRKKSKLTKEKTTANQMAETKLASASNEKSESYSV